MNKAEQYAKSYYSLSDGIKDMVDTFQNYTTELLSSIEPDNEENDMER